MKTYVRIELKSERTSKYKSIQVLCDNSGDNLRVGYFTSTNEKLHEESKIVKCDLREIVILDIKKYFKTGDVTVEIIDPITYEVMKEVLTGFINVDNTCNPHMISMINKFCGYELMKTH